MKYAYLGPQGTFTEAALDLLPAVAGATATPFPTVFAALAAVRSGEYAGAVVPVENSVTGTVPSTLGELAASNSLLRIDAEVELPVTFSLLVNPGTTLADVTRVRSHPHAHGQCQRWLAQQLPNAERLLSDSTAAAAEELALSGRGDEAAIAASIAGRRYGLSTLAEGIGERDDAVTRFILVRGSGPSPAGTGRDCSSLMVTTSSTGAGALVDVLAEFAGRNVNLSWIQSWPEGSVLGRYDFFVTIEGHLDDTDVSEALTAVRRKAASLLFLGSYPRANRHAPTRGKVSQ
ncbi:MAG: Prephenate dehydratase [Amycolatopsis sp.]|uniref:prephenate dehydratase n=1 Tax=Amycolatopsis sp. TaxID=37632 RepID=UPI00260C66D5|nr:prephenate dehydratase [Amycolatopsis sp.]MCU1686589.1 Prephenate dehydratase [Amycolatopsis sp.]